MAPGGGAAAQIVAGPMMRSLSLIRYDWDQKADGQFWSVQFMGQNRHVLPNPRDGELDQRQFQPEPAGGSVLWK